MTMPKTPIDKYYRFKFRQNYIGRPRQTPITQPISKPIMPQPFPHQYLRLCILPFLHIDIHQTLRATSYMGASMLLFAPLREST